MKYHQIPLILAVLGSYTGVVYAATSSEALAACKKHVAETYDGELRTTVRRIRTRSSGTEIKLRVSEDGERFNAICRVDRKGELAYSTDRETATNVIAASDDQAR